MTNWVGHVGPTKKIELTLRRDMQFTKADYIQSFETVFSYSFAGEKRTEDMNS